MTFATNLVLSLLTTALTSPDSSSPTTTQPTGTPSTSDVVIKAVNNGAGAAKSIFDQWFWKPLLVVAIVVAALVVRWLASRVIKLLIDRLTRVDLQPRLTRSRSGRMLLSSAPMLRERRKQRLKTLGSALNSFSSFAIGISVLLTILALFGLLKTPAWVTAGVVTAVLTAVLGFGAQQVIRDFLTGMFLIVEDQYGVGDTVDIGTVSGTVVGVGLRLTQIRDDNGVLWHVRNGEIVSVGNKSQGIGTTTLSIPLTPKANVEQALQVLTDVATQVTSQPEWEQIVLSAPTVTGPDSLSAQSMMFTISIKNAFGEGDALARALRVQVNDALASHNISLGVVPAGS